MSDEWGPHLGATTQFSPCGVGNVREEAAHRECRIQGGRCVSKNRKTKSCLDAIRMLVRPYFSGSRVCSVGTFTDSDKSERITAVLLTAFVRTI